MLALAFNTVMSEHSELEEAILVAQILEDSLEEMDEAAGREAVGDLVVYVDAVLTEEGLRSSVPSHRVDDESKASSLRIR